MPKPIMISGIVTEQGEYDIEIDLDADCIFVHEVLHDGEDSHDQANANTYPRQPDLSGSPEMFMDWAGRVAADLTHPQAPNYGCYHLQHLIQHALSVAYTFTPAAR